MKNFYQKKLLISTVTHGNEEFSIPVVKQLFEKFGNFEWSRNNIRAYRLKKRFFQKDLNRSGPGNLKSAFYEERLAYRLISKYRRYQTVIDIHGSSSNCGIFALLSEASTANIELAKQFDVDKVVLWPSLRAVNGPLTQFIPNSLEIECGPKNDPRVAKELLRILTGFLCKNKPEKLQKFYIVTGRLIGEIPQPMKDFKETKYKGKRFVPLLVGQYPGIKCYTMQRLDETLAT